MGFCIVKKGIRGRILLDYAGTNKIPYDIQILYNIMILCKRNWNVRKLKFSVDCLYNTEDLGISAIDWGVVRIFRVQPDFSGF